MKSAAHPAFLHDATTELAVEMVLGATIVWCSLSANVALTHAEAETAAFRRSKKLNIAAAVLAALAGSVSIALGWRFGKRSAGFKSRWRRLSFALMPVIVCVGLVGGLLSSLGADVGLLLMSCCQGIQPMQRLANSVCATACAGTLGALRFLTLLRWRAFAALGSHGATSAELHDDSAEVGIARTEAPPAIEPGLPALSRLEVLLWLIVDFSLTAGAVQTNAFGFVVCSDPLQSCGALHNWMFDWLVFVAWPVGSAVASTMILANQLGRRGGCAPGKGCCELRTVWVIARGQVVLAVVQLAIVVANSVLGTSGAYQSGAQLQLGPGLGAFGLHAALALVRLRWAAHIIESMVMH